MPAPPSVDLELVATHHKRVVSVVGDSAEPVRHWRLENVTVAHAEATYMDRFEVPSGGDWAVHRGGAFFADGAVDIGVHGCTFDQVDGSGVFLSRHVRNSSVSDNSFYAIGETAILLVGSSAKHRTNMAASVEYPAFNTIERNLVDTVGVWVKQSAAYFKSIARENIVRSNVFMNGVSASCVNLVSLQILCVPECFSLSLHILCLCLFETGPRSGVNFNDGVSASCVSADSLRRCVFSFSLHLLCLCLSEIGAMGGELLEGNLLLNFVRATAPCGLFGLHVCIHWPLWLTDNGQVRESDDHGPFNSCSYSPKHHLTSTLF